MLRSRYPPLSRGQASVCLVESLRGWAEHTEARTTEGYSGCLLSQA